jgi:DNA adenine methylase
MLPEGRRLIEPFAGAGAVFLGTDYDEYLINDVNEDLINLYKNLQTQKESFIEYTRSFFVPENNNAEKFYELRELFNTATDKTLKSALFVYLNRHCFNGLCRFNKKGEFNTPFGKYESPYFPEQEMRFFIEKSQRAVFTCGDFEQIMLEATPGDVIYCDPPYVPLSPSASFTAYASEGFAKRDQERLALVSQLVAHRGIPVLVSNHETDFTLAEYAKAQIESFEMRRTISAKTNKREMAREVLALFT